VTGTMALQQLARTPGPHSVFPGNTSWSYESSEVFSQQPRSLWLCSTQNGWTTRANGNHKPKATQKSNQKIKTHFQSKDQIAEPQRRKQSHLCLARGMWFALCTFTHQIMGSSHAQVTVVLL
jgi:hypothetical protein